MNDEIITGSHHLNARERLDNRNQNSFDLAERRGLMLAATVRTVIMGVIVVWVMADSPGRGLVYVYDFMQPAAFAALGALQYICARHFFQIRSLKYLFVAVDCALLAVIFAISNPFATTSLPPAIAMNSSLFLYFFIFLMQTTFSLRPWLVLWCGFCMVLARTGMLVWFLNQPGVFTNLDLTDRSVEALITARMDPNFLFIGFWSTEVIVALLVAVGLAFVVARSRRLVIRRTSAEVSRASLARYFSPNVVDYLSSSPDALSTAREQEVAILFADIIGFTKLCESKQATEVIELLRNYHSRLGQAVFDNHGTLDKYIGDGLMATFGTPQPGAADAQNALQSAFDMIEALAQWNAERITAGLEPVHVGIGVNYGSVIAGDIGNARRLEYSVIGDAVNVASRLEHLTRSIHTPLVVSDSLVQAIRKSDAPEQPLLDHLTEGGSHKLKGRTSSVRVWVLKTDAVEPIGSLARRQPVAIG